MNPKNKKETNKLKDSSKYDEYFSINEVPSSTDCTGLIPALPVSESEAESYTDLYHIPKQKTNKPR